MPALARATGVAALTALTAGVVVAATLAGPGSAGAAPTPVTVHIGSIDGLLRPDTVGAADPVWNPGLKSAGTARRVRGAGITTLNFDSGGQTDLYDWRTNSLRPDPDEARDTAANGGYSYSSLPPAYDFDTFERVAHAAGARTTVHVNYGTGTAAEAAAWVRYANHVRHDGVRDWIIGEEVYNDEFSEPDRRAPRDGSLEPVAVNAGRYARNVIAFSRAMKAVDPTIRIGVEILDVDPAWTVGDSAVATRLRRFDTWSRDVLATPGLTNAVDFTDVHWLGSYDNPHWTIGNELATVHNVRPAIAHLRRVIDAHTRPGHRVGILAGEINSAPSAMPYSATAGNGAYLADTELTLLENGVEQVHWFSLYSALQAGSPTADLGLLATGNCTTSCEAPVGTPLPTYYAQQLVSRAVGRGGQLLTTTASGTVAAHAVRRPDGQLAVLLINRGAKAADAALRTGPYARWRSAEQTTGTDVHRVAVNPQGTVRLPGYSVTLITAAPGWSGGR